MEISKRLTDWGAHRAAYGLTCQLPCGADWNRPPLRALHGIPPFTDPSQDPKWGFQATGYTRFHI